MYATIPVKTKTKKLVDDLKEAMGARSYDAAILELARARSFLLLKELKGSIRKSPPFERDPNDFERITN